ncbi:MAG: DUF3109 family protein [Bacteroidia bacterium]
MAKPVLPVMIGGVIVSGDVLQEVFTCDLEACKGACCVEGDGGAPLEAEELPLMAQAYEAAKPYLPEKGIQVIEKEGLYIEEYPGTYMTPMVDGNRECAYTVFAEDGMAQCGIELAWRDGKTDFRKPVSCHLYPIRINKSATLEALNYDRWSICSAACVLGKKTKLRVFEFAKEALIRKYGEEFYATLEGAVSAQKKD